MVSFKIFSAIAVSALILTGCAAEPETVVEETIIDEDLWAVDTEYDWDLFQTGGDQFVIVDLESEDGVDATGDNASDVEASDTVTDEVDVDRVNSATEESINDAATVNAVDILNFPVAGDSLMIGAGSIDVFIGRTFSKGDHVVKVEESGVVLFIAGSSTCTPFPIDTVNNIAAGTKDIIMSPPLLSTPCSSEYRQYFYTVDLSTPVVKGDLIRFCTDTGRCYTLTEIR